MSRSEPQGTAPGVLPVPPPARIESGVRERFGLTNLGHAPTRFVGRRRELSELRTLVAEHGVVTVLGAPGVGKSRLATELARAVLSEYGEAGGAWRVDLSEAKDADGVCAAVTRTLGVGAASGNVDSPTALGAALASRGKTLLVLDGADGCVLPLGRTLSTWLSTAPDVRCIVTSRTRLGIEGEAVLDLGPLAVVESSGGAPDAVWLFVDRARAARTDLVLDDRTSQDVLELVRRLDGIPLAIELAAARTRSLTPAQMLEQESSRFDLLGSGGHHADPRHSTLRAAIDSSWELLEEWHRDALTQLSIFAAGFDIDAASAVLDLSGNAGTLRVTDAIEALRDRSLLSAAPSEGGDRLRFSLYGSVREYAREQLFLRGGREAAVLRHARHFVAEGARWAKLNDEGCSHEAASWLARETENLMAAHRRMLLRGREGAELAIGAALALDPLLAASGPGALRLALLDAAITAASKEDVEPGLRLRALEARSDAHRLLGRGPEAVADAQAALALATSCRDRAAVGRILRELAMLALVQGKLSEGRGLLERACTIDRETGDRREEGRALGLIGSVAALEGNLDAAWSTLDRAIVIHREVNDLRFEAISTGNLAVVAHDAGRLAEARVHCERALAVCRRAGNRRLEAEALGLLAAVAHESDRTAEARDLYRRALTMHREVGNRRAEGALLGYHGALLAEEGESEGARAAYARALTILRDCQDRANEALVLGALAGIEAREGCVESSRAALAHATECLEGIDEPRARAAVHLWRGHLELALAKEAWAEGDEGRSQRLVDDARRRLEEAKPTDRGEVRRAADVRLAHRALFRALSTLSRTGAPASEPPAAEGPPPGTPADALVVCARGRWFRGPRGQVVSVARWRPLQRLLERLAERREISPGEHLSVEALVSAGWPGERMLPKAGATRVYTAVASLRRLGLRDMLVRDERGYMLRTDVPITRVSRAT